MGKNYWMMRISPQEFEEARFAGFPAMRFSVRQRRKAQRMQPGDRVLFYLADARCFPATATVASAAAEEQARGRQNGEYDFKVSLTPNYLMKVEDYLDALQIGPRMEYVRRWPPEDWFLAFQGNFHLIPQRDFNLVENEMKRIVSPQRRARPTPQQSYPDNGASGDQGEAGDDNV